MGRRDFVNNEERALRVYVPQPRPERVILVGVEWPHPKNQRNCHEEPLRLLPEESLDELARLSETAGLEVIERVVQPLRDGIHPATFIGTGKVSEVKSLVTQTCTNAVI